MVISELVMKMRINRVIRAVIGVILLAVLVFCIYKRLEATPATEDPAGVTETVEMLHRRKAIFYEQI